MYIVEQSDVFKKASIDPVATEHAGAHDFVLWEDSLASANLIVFPLLAPAVLLSIY